MSTASGRTAELTVQEKRALLTHLLQQKAQSPLSALSYGQQALWLTHQLAPESWTYHVVFSVRIRSEVDLAALQGAFQTLSERHPILRTTYRVSHGTPAQEVRTQTQVDFTALDASGYSQDAFSQQLLVAEARQPFDLERGPVMRVRVLTRSVREHVLLLVVHHIAIDFWSLGILLDELRVLYPAEKTGVPASLPALERQYTDYVQQQAATLAGAEGERLWAFWQHQLAGVTSALQLPTDRHRPPVQTYAGATHTFTLSTPLTQRLKALAQAEGATLYTTLLAAFYVLLYRYTGQEDILIGAPMANRLQPEFRGVVGYFVNPVVLRATPTAFASFRAFLGQVRHTVLQALKHQNYPFALLVERLQPARDSSRSPLFQVMFVLQQLHGREDLMACFAPEAVGAQTDFAGLLLEPLALAQQEGQFDLTLEMAEVGGSLWGGFKYNTDLFNAATISRLAGHLQTLLASIVTNPEQQLAALPLLTEAERQQLLRQGKHTRRTSLSEQCVHQMFAAQAGRTPDAIALVCGGVQLTYQELHRQANQLAHYLRSLGVGPEALVGICVERSLDMVVGLLGILKAGGAYVPLDPAYPQERLAFMLEDTQTLVLLTQERLSSRLPKCKAQVVCLDTDWDVIAQAREQTWDSPISAENLAYINYTSGSTGQPKGVGIPHRGIIRLVLGLDKVRLDTTQTFLQMAPISFDAATFEIWGCLLHGGRCVLFPEPLPTSRSLGQAIRHHGISTLWLTAALFNAVIDEAPDVLASLQQLLVGGEALSVSHVRRALAVLPSTQIVNGYGPTESTTFACCYPLPGQLGETISSIPIGRPIGNTEVYLLDHCLQPVPSGVAGELHIGGAGLARGYLNRPELTAETFIPHPFSDQPGARLYKTGDLARHLPNGDIEFLGRLDSQVKIRGFRIEPAEIEAVLEQHAAVRQSAVIVDADRGSEKRLVAYVVPAQPPAPSQDELRRFLQASLPNYMVPAIFVRLDSLPLTPNGKVDRRALPPPEPARGAEETVRVLPRTPMEKALAQLWSDLLGIEQVGTDADFFALGGHSLLAAQLMSRMHQTFGQDFPLAVLFQASTITDLARCLEDARPPASRLLVPIQAHGSRAPLFCLHPAGGQVLVYRSFATFFDPAQPLYALQSRVLSTALPEQHTLDDMAIAYAAVIRTQQPKGPYYLLGWSMGGVLALAATRVLEQQGHHVAFVGLLDTRLLTNADLSHDPLLQLLLACGSTMAAAVMALAPAEQHALRQTLLALPSPERLQRLVTWGQQTHLLPTDLPLEILKRQAALAEDHIALFRAHQALPVQAPLYVWWARDDLEQGPPCTNWSRYTGTAAHIDVVAGNHFSMLQPPHVQDLAERVQACLWATQITTASAIPGCHKMSL